VLNPGVAVLTFTPPGRFVVDRLHSVPASSGVSSFVQPGCLIQPLTVKDKVKDDAYSAATNRVFAPPNANTLTVMAEWYVTDAANNSYRIIGVRSVPDVFGRVLQCEFMAKFEEG
jgi:hypothetical protein